ncbi:retrovirus-related pol polyprotein from transposon TNT 1-94, partial [Tanacetum coccineum]
SKDETPGVLIDFLTLVQRGHHAQVTTVQTDKCTKFLNKTLQAYFAKEGIRHETSTARTPKQNGVADPPPLNIHSTHQTPTQVPTVTAPENIIQAETVSPKIW